MNTDVSIQTASRDVEILKGLRRSTIYRLAYQLQIFSDDATEKAFSKNNIDEMAHILKVALDQYDAGVSVTQITSVIPTNPQAPGTVMNPVQPAQPVVQAAPMAMPPPPQMQIPGMAQQVPTQAMLPPQQQVQQVATPAQMPQQGMPPIPAHMPPQGAPQTMLPPMTQAMNVPQQVQQAMPLPQQVPQGMPSPMAMPAPQQVQQAMTAVVPPPVAVHSPMAVKPKNPSDAVGPLLDKITAMTKASAEVARRNQKWMEEIQTQQSVILHMLKVALRLQVGALSQQYSLDGASLRQSALMNEEVFNAFLEAPAPSHVNPAPSGK